MHGGFLRETSGSIDEETKLPSYRQDAKTAGMKLRTPASQPFRPLNDQKKAIFMGFIRHLRSALSQFYAFRPENPLHENVIRTKSDHDPHLTGHRHDQPGAAVSACGFPADPSGT
jgi:hypothetical protein